MKRDSQTARPTSAVELLDAVPLVNRAARLLPGSKGDTLAEIPMRRPRFLVPPLSWLLPYSRVRRVHLDRLGARILALCNGKNTVEEIIETFADEEKLTFREAQLAIIPFLQLVLQRGIVALLVK
ncbi:MAG: PqqD family protein [Kiritimatiellia bacterium]